MNTTYLLIELLISGLFFFLSLIPLIALIFNYDLVTVFSFHQRIFWPYQILISYAAGIVWNRVCDQIFSKFEEKIILTKFLSKDDYISARLKVILHGPSLKGYLETLRSLLRVARVSSITLIIYSLTAPIYLLRNLDTLSLIQKLIIVILFIVLTMATIYSWHRLQKSYVTVVFYTYRHIANDEEKDIVLKKAKGIYNE